MVNVHSSNKLHRIDLVVNHALYVFITKSFFNDECTFQDAQVNGHLDPGNMNLYKFMITYYLFFMLNLSYVYLSN